MQNTNQTLLSISDRSRNTTPDDAICNPIKN